MGGRGGVWGLAASAPLLLAAIQAPEAKKPAEPLKSPPRAYFADHCQRCHGVDGDHFIPGFADEPEAKLRADIVRMADGAGAAPLKPEDVDVQMAYHRLISAQRPFVAWTARDGLTLKGEVTDGATLTSNVGDPKIADDGTWTLVLASASDFAKLKLTATLDKKETVLTPAESPFAKPDRPKTTP